MTDAADQEARNVRRMIDDYNAATHAPLILSEAQAARLRAAGVTGGGVLVLPDVVGGEVKTSLDA